MRFRSIFSPTHVWVWKLVRCLSAAPKFSNKIKGYRREHVTLFSFCRLFPCCVTVLKEGEIGAREMILREAEARKCESYARFPGEFIPSR